MNSAVLTAPDNLATAYARLGLTPKYREQLISNANDALRIVRNAPRVTAEEIDTTVERIAQSDYAEKGNRAATIQEAIAHDIFTPRNSHIIKNASFQEKDAEGLRPTFLIQEEHKKINLFNEETDIRKGFELLQRAPTQYSATTRLGGTRFLTTKPRNLNQDEYIKLLRELALVSAVCREMGGFDPQAEIKFAFKRNGLAFDPFAKAVRQDPNLARLTAEFVQKL